MAGTALLGIAIVLLLIGWGLRRGVRAARAGGGANGGQVSRGGGFKELIGLLANLMGIVAGGLAIWQFLQGKS